MPLETLENCPTFTIEHSVGGTLLPLQWLAGPFLAVSPLQIGLGTALGRNKEESENFLNHAPSPVLSLEPLLCCQPNTDTPGQNKLYITTFSYVLHKESSCSLLIKSLSVLYTSQLGG